MKMIELPPAVCLALTLLYYELLVRRPTARLFSSSLIFIAAAALAFGSLLAFLLSYLPPQMQKAPFIGLQLLFFSFYFSQRIYFSLFRMFFPFASLRGGAQILAFYKDILRAVWSFKFELVFWLLPLLFTICFFRPHTKQHVRLLPLGLAVLCAAILVMRIKLDDRKLNGTWDVLFNERQLLLSSERLGLASSFLLTLARSSAAEPIRHPPPSPVSLATTSATSSPAAAATAPTQEKSIKRYAPNSLPLDFSALRKDFSGEDRWQEMLDYLENLTPTQKNEHSGRWAGYNLIYIVAESLAPYAIREDLTPTLWQMSHVGMEFTNAYNPVWGVSTLDGEYAALLGLIPKSGVWSMAETTGNDMTLAPGCLLGRLNYSTRAYHNNYYDYYERDLSHPKLGYDYKGLGNGLEVEEIWPESDLEMIEKTLPEFIGDEPFHTYYLTVSGHMNYSFSGNSMASKNAELVEQLPYSEESRAYLAAQIEFDRAMQSLLTGLRKAGIAERTIIAISPDHYPYGLSDEAIEELSGQPLKGPYDLQKSCLILYVDGAAHERIDKYCSSLDLLPTVYNLMGLPYDSRLLSGRDIFSDSPGLVPFSDYGWASAEGTYDADNTEFIPRPAARHKLLESEIEQINADVEWRFRFARFALEEDFFRYALPDSLWANVLNGDAE